jgi:hypothetical protein
VIMQRLTKNPMLRTNREPISPRFCGEYGIGLLLCLLVAAMSFSACGVGNTSGVPQLPATLSGNWQFTMAAPADGSFSGGLQGGFLLQKDSAVTGAAVYSVALPANPNPCNSGSAAITGTLSNQSVALTAVAGTQTFTFAGTLSLSGSTMGGTYTSTAGTAADGTGCGTAQTGLQWSAILVPPLTGPIQGSFHSTGGTAGLVEQDFLVSGALFQGENTGASNATVTGNLNFLSPTTDLSDYPCLTTATIKGQISGNTATLQIVGTDGSNVGQIGALPGSVLQPVIFGSTQNGYALQSFGPGYAVYAAACGGGSLESPADSGNICLAVNGTTACQQPITLSPTALTFPSQPVDSPPTMLTITLTNTSGGALGGLTLTLTNNSGPANFVETDACGLQGAPSQGQPFDLDRQQSCVITIAFTPLENCATGVPPAQCLAATLIVTSPNNDSIFTVPITGGVTASIASAAELDIGTRGVSEPSLSQLLRFTLQSPLLQTRPSSRALQDAGQHAEID